jgi:flagellar basal-body rod protein FlgF
MENAITAALSKQIVLARALDIAANNVANQTTAGFKAEQTRFGEYVSVIAGDATEDRTVSLVYDLDSYTDFCAGGLLETRASLDFAIDGDGFFAVQADAGVRYTRDGHLTLSAFGELVDRNGSLVLDDANAPILIDPEQGPILLSQEGELQQDGAPIARLGVFVFEDPGSLRRTGFNQYSSFEDPQQATGARIRQGFVETSNVAPVKAMTEMIDIMRAYESAAQVIETSTELARNAVQTLTEAA